MAGKAGRRVGKLAARFVETVTKPGLYGDGAGLYLKVGDGGTRSWIYRFALNGKPQKIGLGAVHTIGLTEARDRAEAARKLVFDGINPKEARRAEKAAAAVAEAKIITFDAARDAYIKAHKAGWKSDKHAAQWQATLDTYASPVFGKLPVAAVDIGMVMRVLEPIWSTKNETAHRVRGRIEAVLDWAKVREYRSGENPARWKGHLDHLLPARRKVRKVKHHPALPYAEMPAFMRDLRARYGVAALALEFAILTACRTNEVAQREYGRSSISATGCGQSRRAHEGRAASIACRCLIAPSPSSRTWRPTSAATLSSQEQRAASRFPTWRCCCCCGGWSAPISPSTASALRSAHGRQSERTSRARSPKQRSRMLSATKTETAYQRGDLFDKRRRLMDAWAAFCETRPTIKSGDVIALRP